MHGESGITLCHIYMHSSCSKTVTALHLYRQLKHKQTNKSRQRRKKKAGFMVSEANHHSRTLLHHLKKQNISTERYTLD